MSDHSAASNKKIIGKKEISVIIMVILCFSGWVLPPFAGITPLGMKVLGVFLGMIYGWIFVALGWTSLFGFIVLALTGYYVTVNEAVIAGIGNAVVLQTLVSFILAGVIEISGLGSVILAQFLKIKSIGKHPWLFAGVLFAAVSCISILADSLAAIFLIWAVINEVAKTNNSPKGDEYIAFLYGGTVIASYTLMGSVPFKVTGLTFYGFFESANTGLSIEMIPFIGYAMLMFILAMAGLIFIARFVYRIDASNFEFSEEQLSQFSNIEITNNHKKGIFLIIVLFTCLLTPGILLKSWTFTQIMTKMSLLGSMILVIALGQVLKNDEGEIYAPFRKICSAVNWDVLWLMAITFPLAAAMESPDCGIINSIQATVMPMLQDMSPYMFIMIVMVMCGILTQFMHNVILGAMFMPVCIKLIVGMGGNPIVLWFAMYFALTSAYGTPAASAVAGIMFGHECVPKLSGYKFGFGHCIAMIFVTAIVGIPLGYLIF